ncbi:MAG TPA: HAD family hydrolase, partial [Leucothrix sp.]|nr:HAD family hydrolase [Leucothrix sp.]
AEFLRLRSNFTVPKSSFDLLATLAEHYPVIAITNGNVDTDKINLSDKFQFILKAGDGLNAKPEGDLFIKAARILDIEVSDILHIGDHLISDVYGAENNGAQAIWFNEHDLPLTDAKTLPSVEISNVELLIPLLLQKDQ